MNERQREIVAETLKLISQRGIQEFTIKKIATAIGVTEPAIYRHFASKSDILQAVIDNIEETRNAVIRKVAKEKGSVSEMLRTFFIGQAQLFEQESTLTVILFSEDLFRGNEVLFQRIKAMIDQNIRWIQDLLEQGKRNGEFVKGVDAGTAALMLIGGFRLLVSSWRMENFSFSLEARTRAFVDSAMKLLRGHY